MDPTCVRDTKSATQFCTCRHQMTLLCDKCLIAHLTETPGELHDFSPIAYFDACKSLGLDQFHVQKAQLKSGSALIHTLIEAEKFQYEETLRKLEESTKICREIVEALHASFLLLVDKFEQEKVTLLAMVDPPLSKFSSSLLSISKTSTLPVKRFFDIPTLTDFHNTLLALQGHMQTLDAEDRFETHFSKLILGESDATLEIKIKMPPQAEEIKEKKDGEHLMELPVPAVENFTPYVPIIQEEFLSKYIITSGAVETVELSRGFEFSLFTVYIVLPNGNLFVCGGAKKFDRQACLVNATTGEVTELQKLRVGRGNPGIVYIDGKVFAFGGRSTRSDADLKSAEKFQFHTREWSVLSSEMSGPRFQFTPYLHEQTVYIATGAPTMTIEAFDVVSEQFSLCDFSLSKPIPGICVVYNGELVALQNQKLLRYELNSQQEPVKRKVTIPAKDSNASVQVIGEKAYYSYVSQVFWAIHALDLSTWETTELVKTQLGGAGEARACKVE